MPTAWSRAGRAASSALSMIVALSLTATVPAAIRHATATARTDFAAMRDAPGGATDAGLSAAEGIDIRDGAAAADPLPVQAPLPDRSAPFEIELPDGWSGGEVDEHSHEDDAARSWRYTDGAGAYFVVNVDPEGGDFAADEVWRYRVDGDRFVIATREACTQGEGLCSLGDGRLTIYAIWTEGGSASVGAHRYYFRFGDERDEGAGTRTFRAILHGLRVVR